MRVHDADLAPEEGAALGALEVALRSARGTRGGRSKRRAPSGASRCCADQRDVRARLLGREQLGRGSRGSSAAGGSGCRCSRSRGCSRSLDAAVGAEVREAGEHAVGDQQALEVVAHLRGDRLERAAPARRDRRGAAPRPACAASGTCSVTVHALHRRSRMAGSPAGASRSSRRGRRPRAACPGSRALRSRRARARRAARSSRARRARRPRRGRTAPTSSRIDASSDASRYCASASTGQKTMSPCESSGTDVALALEEHEPLRPVAVRVLVAEDAQQQVAHRLASGRARAAARRVPGRRRACPSRRPSTARDRAARGSGSARRARTRAGSPGGARRRRRAATSRPAAGGAARSCRARTARRVRDRRRGPTRRRRLRPASTRWPVIRKPTDRDAARHEHEEGLIPRLRPSAKSSSSPPTASMVVPRAGSMRKQPSGKRRPTSLSGGAPSATPRSSRASAQRHGVRAVVAAERHVAATPGSGTARPSTTSISSRSSWLDDAPPGCAPRCVRPRAGRSSGSRSDPSRTPTARRAAASRPRPRRRRAARASGRARGSCASWTGSD